ncbi:MAG: DNA/RNA non-specific endonuclease [Tannerellaceae bacterium]
MVQRKSKAKPRGKKKRKISAIQILLKKILLAVSAAIACMIAFLYIWNSFYPISNKQSVLAEQSASPIERVVPKTNRPNEKKQSPQKPLSTEKKQQIQSVSTFKLPAQAEIPQLKVHRTEQIIKHEGYTVSYNSNYKIANWVAYELTPEEARSKKAERSNKFVPDPLVKGATAINEDYSRSGFDRGHMAPAGDMKWSVKAMRESFYFSNICPQQPGLNRGVWKALEEQSRLWALDGNSMLIVTGPVITDDLKPLGKNRVGVPKQFYKVLCYVAGNKPRGIAFLFENRDYPAVSLKDMAIPIDSVEKVTGIDFFTALPDALEEEMEANIHFGNWSF